MAATKEPDDEDTKQPADCKTKQIHQLVVRTKTIKKDYQARGTMLSSFLISFVVIFVLLRQFVGSLAHQVPDLDGKIRVRIGVLLEESDHDQANMFIRTIKMINERRDETIRQLLSLSASARKQQPTAAASPTSTTSKRRTKKSLANRAADEQEAAVFANCTTRTAGNFGHSDPDRFGQDKTTASGSGGLAGGKEPALRDVVAFETTTTTTEGDEQHHHHHPEHESRAPAARATTTNNNEINSTAIEKPINNDKSNGAQGSFVALNDAARGSGAAGEFTLLASNVAGAQGPNGGEHQQQQLASEDKFSARRKNVRRHRSIAGYDHDGNELAANQHFQDNVGDDEEAAAAAAAADGTSADPGEARPATPPNNIRLEPMIEFLSDGQSALEADGKVCQLIESGVHAIVGPLDGNSIQHVQSICDNLEIPYFELRPFVGGTLVAPIPIPVSSSATAAAGSGGGNSAPSSTSSWSWSTSSAATAIVDSSKIQLQAKGEQPKANDKQQRRLKHNTNNSNHQPASGSSTGATQRKQSKKTRRTRRRNNGSGNNNNNKSIERHQQRFAQNQQLVKEEPRAAAGPLDNDVDQSGAGDSAVFQFNRDQGGQNASGATMSQREHGDDKRQLSSSQLAEPSALVDRVTNFSDQQLKNDQDDDDGTEEDDEEEEEEEDGEAGNYSEDEPASAESPPPATTTTTATDSAKNSKILSKSTGWSDGHYNNNKNDNNSDSLRTRTPDNHSAWTTGEISSSNNNNQHHFSAFQPPTESINNKLEDLTINLYPPSHLLTSAYIDMIYALNWTSFAIVYEDGTSMIKLQDLLKESSTSGTWASRWKIRLFRYDSDSLESAEAPAARGFSGGGGKYDTQDKSATNNNDNKLANGGQQQQPHSNVAPPTPRRPIASALLSDDGNLSAADSENLKLSHFFGGGGNDLELASDNSTGQADNSIRTSRSLRAADSLAARDEFNIDHQHQQQQRQPEDLLPQRDAPGGNKFQYSTTARYNTRVAASNNKVTNNKQHQNGRGSFRDVFWRIKLTGEQNILLDVKTDNLYEALKQAQQVGCMTEEYSYLITSLDLHTIDLEDFKYSRTKITGFSLIQVAKQQRSILRQANGQLRLNNNNKNDINLLRGRPVFDEKYLENLGIFHLIQQDEHNSLAGQQQQPEAELSSQSPGAAGPPKAGLASDSAPRPSTSSDNNKKSPKLGQFENEAANNDQTRRELLQSSPASLSLLPTLDRNNEQRLFDFFLQQQERDLSRTRLSTSSAILHDSLILYMLGLNELDPNGNFLGNLQPITCSLESQPWSHGSSMVNYMRQISFSGLTGAISFDQRGLRTNFKLDVMGMAPNLRLVKVGEWHSNQAVDPQRKQYAHRSSGEASQHDQQGAENGTANSDTADSEGDKNISDATADRSYEELSSRYELELKQYTRLLAGGKKIEVPYTKRVSPDGALLVNEIIFERLYHDQADQIDTLIVTAKLSQPYFMLKETPNKLDGNDQFEGYAVDLIHELSKLVNFRYKWREVADKKYGSKEVLPNGTVVWNGMIGEIVRGVADLAIVDLTITAQREEAVDFTLPFMNTGISILFKKPTTKVTTLFSFLSPFSSDVWAYVLAAYCGISAILFLVGHLSPYEWADPHPCRHITKEDGAVLKNQFSLLNSFWFTIGSLMQQGSDLTPRSMSTRTIAGIWYFFTLIMISSYTANLAAFLTVEKVVYPIENVRDLSQQQEIKYGCVESGSTCLFFHDSQIDTYKKINENMRGFKTNVRSNDEGQKRVGEGKFAFFMESTTIEYIIERNCNLTQIGGLIDSKGYGLATSKKSRYKRPYRTLLNEGILHLQETGMLHVLKNRWWKERRGGGTCTDDGKGGGVTELSLANVGGVFVVLLGGLGISFLVAIAEFMWRARRGGSTRDRMCEEMMNDLKFALACKSSTKPNRKLANGGGGRLSRNRTAMLSQQDSMMSSQYQYDDILDPTLLLNYQQQQQPFNTKECDPILLHAMLTMLMQQQQQQHQVAQLSSSVVPPHRPEGLVDVEKHQSRVLANSLMTQPRGRTANHLNGYGSSTSFIDENLRGAPGVHNHQHQQQQQQQSQQQQRQYNNWSQANHVAGGGGRRRTLQSQQTIDLADDNLSNIPINHFT